MIYFLFLESEDALDEFLYCVFFLLWIYDRGVLASSRFVALLLGYASATAVTARTNIVFCARALLVAVVAVAAFLAVAVLWLLTWLGWLSVLLLAVWLLLIVALLVWLAVSVSLLSVISLLWLVTALLGLIFTLLSLRLLALLLIAAWCFFLTLVRLVWLALVGSLVTVFLTAVLGAVLSAFAVFAVASSVVSGCCCSLAAHLAGLAFCSAACRFRFSAVCYFSAVAYFRPAESAPVCLAVRCCVVLFPDARLACLACACGQSGHGLSDGGSWRCSFRLRRFRRCLVCCFCRFFRWRPSSGLRLCHGRYCPDEHCFLCQGAAGCCCGVSGCCCSLAARLAGLAFCSAACRLAAAYCRPAGLACRFRFSAVCYFSAVAYFRPAESAPVCLAVQIGRAHV